MTRRIVLMLLWLLCTAVDAGAQEFFNLTADEVRIDSVLPRFSWAQELGVQYADSDYTVSIEYPEFIDMTPTDVTRYQRLCSDLPPSMPVVEQCVGVNRRKGVLHVSFVPIVFREGRLQKLVSFKLKVVGHASERARSSMPLTRSEASPTTDSTRYAAHSILASGRWAKISVSESGIHQLTEATVRRAGFSSLSRVKIYGYGGALQPELLTGDYIRETDDLQEVPTCTVGGRRLFWAAGPVSWSSETTLTRTRNPYSNYGYYFITESNDEPLSVDSAAFVGMGWPSAADYHSLYEVDNFAWYHGGRNLYEETVFTVGTPRHFTLPAYSAEGKLSVVMTSAGAYQAQLTLNGDTIGTLKSTNDNLGYNTAEVLTFSYDVANLQASNTIAITQTSGATIRLDYIALVSNEPRPKPDLTADTFPQAAYVYNITNQDHHADPQADMVIIIPTTQKLLTQAQRLKQMHEQQDSLRVTIVPADELFNEFSSGTPDANAYRRYLKMLYDRAGSEADMPRYLLLMGACAWDNRMLTSDWRNASPDDYLLCYESENSVSHTDCYVTDDYFCLLDDGEGGNLQAGDLTDVAVGRFTATTDAEAATMVDKTIGYRNNSNAGAWQNTICFMADDGNGNDQNQHMSDAETIIAEIEKNHPGYMIKKIYWDAFVRNTSATGNTYPEAERLAKQQMQDGALIMDYQGHGAAYQISHEKVLQRSDFATSTSLRLPLWITASCDIMPVDAGEENIGHTAMLNKNGGAIAFFGTTRTVYQDRNMKINRSVVRNLLDTSSGQPNAIGEAIRKAKNGLVTATSSGERDLTVNKLNYMLLGDPALRLALPLRRVVIDSINGRPVSTDTVAIAAGTMATISGHIEGEDSFEGIVTLSVRDVEQTVVCKLNYISSVDIPYRYQDRPNTLYQGSCYVRGGRFNTSFAISKDISFSDDTGQVLAYAVNDVKTLTAHGVNENFTMTGQESEANDGVGPNIYCYLNSSSFTNGGTVNATPHFHADVSDKDGINASGSGIGHDLELIIDSDPTRTYILNSYFQYDFGNYRSGSVDYTVPTLDAGEHKLLFRAWDVLNNSTAAQLTFVVDPQLEPSIAGVICTKNPASTSTTFIINHDRTGSNIDVTLEIFDTAGRKLWEHSESGVPTDHTYRVDWDLTTGSGKQLGTGVYVYRVLVSADGSSEATYAQKLIILRK